MKYQLTPETYKGESIRYVQNIIGDKKVVTATWISDKFKKILGVQGKSKAEVRSQIRRTVDNYKS